MSTASPTVRPLASASPDFSPQVEKSLTAAALYHCSSPASVSTCSYSCVKNSESFGSSVNQKMSDRDAAPQTDAELRAAPATQIAESHVERWADEYDDDEEFLQPPPPAITPQKKHHFNRNQDYDFAPPPEPRYRQTPKERNAPSSAGGYRNFQKKNQKSSTSGDLHDIWSAKMTQEPDFNVETPPWSGLSRQISQGNKRRDIGERSFHYMKSSSPSISRNTMDSSYTSTQPKTLLKSQSSGADAHKQRSKIFKNIITEVVDSSASERNVNIFGPGRLREEVIQAASNSSVKDVTLKPHKVDPFGGAKPQDIFVVEERKKLEKSELMRKNQLRSNCIPTGAPPPNSITSEMAKDEIVDQHKNSTVYDNIESSSLNLQYDSYSSGQNKVIPSPITADNSEPTTNCSKGVAQRENISMRFDDQGNLSVTASPPQFIQQPGAATAPPPPIAHPVCMVQCEVPQKYPDANNSAPPAYFLQPTIPFNNPATVMVPNGPVSGSFTTTALPKTATSAATYGISYCVQPDHNAVGTGAPSNGSSSQPQQFFLVQHSPNHVLHTTQPTSSPSTQFIPAKNMMDFQSQPVELRQMHYHMSTSNQSVTEAQSENKHLDAENTSIHSGQKQGFCYNQSNKSTYGAGYHEDQSSAAADSDAASSVKNNQSSSSPSDVYAMKRVLASPVMYAAGSTMSQPQSSDASARLGAMFDSSKEPIIYSSSNGQYISNGYSMQQQHDFNSSSQKVGPIDTALHHDTAAYHTLPGSSSPCEEHSNVPPPPQTRGYQIFKRTPSTMTSADITDKRTPLTSSPVMKHQSEPTSGQQRSRRLKVENKPMLQELVKATVEENASKATWLSQTQSDDQALIDENKEKMSNGYELTQGPEYNTKPTSAGESQFVSHKSENNVHNFTPMSEIPTKDSPREVIDNTQQKPSRLNSGFGTSPNNTRSSSRRQPKYQLYQPHNSTILDGAGLSSSNHYSSQTNRKRNNSNSRGGCGSFESRNNARYRNSNAVSNDINSNSHHINNKSNAAANVQTAGKSTSFSKSSSNNNQQQLTPNNRNWTRLNDNNSQGVGNKDHAQFQHTKYDSRVGNSSTGGGYYRQGSQRRHHKGHFSRQKSLDDHHINNDHSNNKYEKKWQQCTKIDNNKTDSMKSSYSPGKDQLAVSGNGSSYARVSSDNKTSLMENSTTKVNNNILNSAPKRKFGSNKSQHNRQEPSSQVEYGTNRAAVNTQQTPVKTNTGVKVTNQFQVLDSETEDGKND